MKKYIVIGIIFILLTVTTFYIVFFEESTVQYNKMINIGEGENSSSIIVSVGNNKQTDLHELFKTYLKKYKGNLFCSDISSEAGKVIYTKYVYFTNNRFLNNIKLTKGRFLDISENESDKFLSTEDTKKSNQIGQISDFSGQKHFEIRTIKSSPLNNLFERILTVQFENKTSVDKFINDIDKAGVKIQKKYGSNGERTTATPIILITGAFYLILMLIIFYSLLNSYKKIAVEKMLGFRNFSIWLKRIMPIAVIEVIAMITASCVMIILCFKTYNQYFLHFIGKLSIIYGMMLLVSIVLMTIPFLYTKSISISNMLKNKRPVKEIVIFNTIIKIGLIVLFLVLAVNEYKQYQVISSRYISSLNNWEKTKDYAVIPSIRSDTSINYDSFSQDEMEKNKKLYLYFNYKGALVADFYNLEPKIYQLNSKHLKEAYQLDMVTVNPNYLDANKIFAEDGDRISIDESESSYILLVPQKYHPKEKEILRFYQYIANGDSHNIIKIIWTKPKQKFFTYTLSINPNDGNCVEDPVIRVLTESNGDLVDYNIVAGTMGNPLKIKVPDSSNPIGSILKEFEKYYDLSKFNFPVTLVYDLVETQIQSVKNAMQIMSIGMLLLILMIFAIVLQNIVNYFEQNRMRLAIQKFHGYKKLDRYRNYLGGLCISWTFIIIFSLLMNRSYEVILISLLLMIIEFIVSIILFNIIEKRKVLTVTKGG